MSSTKRDPPKKISSAKVLTSAENLKILEEKEKEKKEKAEAKEKRKQQQELKAKEKEKQKLALAVEKENRRREREVQARKKEQRKVSPRKKAKADTNSGKSMVFTDEEERLFRRRMSNGYDVHDPKYLQWLEIFHPAEAKKLATNPPPDASHLLQSRDATSMSQCATQVPCDPKSGTRVHKYPTRSSGKTLSAQVNLPERKSYPLRNRK